jgi:hypothetical protein
VGERTGEVATLIEVALEGLRRLARVCVCRGWDPRIPPLPHRTDVYSKVLFYNWRELFYNSKVLFYKRSGNFICTLL